LRQEVEVKDACIRTGAKRTPVPSKQPGFARFFFAQKVSQRIGLRQAFN